MIVPPLCDHLLEGCQIITHDWRYAYLNDVAAAQARRAKEELLGRTMQECYPGIEQAPMFAALERCMRERAPGGAEAEFAFPDGSRFWFDLRFLPVDDGVCILSMDVTGRRHALAALVDDSDDAIIGLAASGAVTSWNAGAERLYGWRADEMLGRSIDVLLPPGEDDESPLADRLLRGERVPPFETRRRARDGRLIDLSLAISPVRDAHGSLVGTARIARDITRLKEIQRELTEAKRATDVAREELESFSYSVAHDLRAPLRAIDGFSQAVLEDQADRLDDQGRRHLRLVRESARRMADLIDDLLALSRVTRAPLARTRVDVSALARAIGARLAAREPGRSVVLEVQDEVIADADPRLLAVVLENLLENAWKFTSGRAPAHVAVGADRLGDEVVHWVRDDGAGFSMEHVHKLFGAFQRLHGAHEFDGTGIGLATCRRVVLRHGGRIWAEGRVGGGATFRFTLGKD